MPSERDESSKESIRTESSSGMDNVKDVKKNQISIFLDNQTLRTDPFGQNISAEQLYTRSERIVVAMHLVTNHIDATEPVRDVVRKKSLRLLAQALALRSELRATGSERVRIMQASLRELISLIRVVGVSGKVSVQNTQLLVEALDELGNLLVTSQRSILAEAVPLSRDDLVPKVEQAPKQKMSRVRESRVRPQQFIKDIIVKDSEKGESASSQARTGRILDILRAGGLLGIRDISSNLPEYSEKMVQRDLALLVQHNQVKKIGAKRWSKYEVVR